MFIAQESYEMEADTHRPRTGRYGARAHVVPPQVVAGDLGFLELASARKAEADGATFWADVVGVDAARAADSGLFRVVEWGGI